VRRRHVALRAGIVSAENIAATRTLTDAAVLLTRGIAQINWRRPDGIGGGVALDQTAAPLAPRRFSARRSR